MAAACRTAVRQGHHAGGCLLLLIVVNDDKVLDTPMDYATVRTLGSDLGSASVIVIDDTVSIEWLVNKTVHFFKHELCGKCTPCREGTYWMSHHHRAHPLAGMAPPGMWTCC